MTALLEADHRLVTLARAAATGTGTVGAILRDAADIPPLVGPTAAGLIEDALARGVAKRLATTGWQTRFWQKNPPQLRFTSNSVRLLQWAARTPLGRSGPAETGVPRLETLGDELVAYGLAGHLARHSLVLALAQPPFTTSALCVLGFGELLPVVADWTGWTEGDRATTLLILQPELARGVERFESALLAVPTADRQIALGEARDATLSRLIASAELADRLDLLDFLATARPTGGRAPTDAGATMLRRQRAGSATGAQPRATLRLGLLLDRARSVRFFEDEYSTAQGLLRRWRDLTPERLRALAHADAARREMAHPPDSPEIP